MPAPIAVLQPSQLRATPGNKKSTTSAGIQIGSSTPRGHSIACKCAICTCGSHRCAEEKDCITHYDPALLKTTSQMDFDRKNAAPAQSAAPKRDYKPSPVKFSAESTYNSQHNGEHADPATPFKPEGNNDTIHPSNERFWSTESRNMFDNKGNAQRSSFKPKNVATASVPFEGVTSNKAEYQNWKGARPSSPFRAKNEIDHNPESRDFQSEARKQYVQHPYSKADIFVPKQRANNAAPFQGQTTAQADFQAWKIEPSAAFRPVSQTQFLDESRDFTSEARSQYGQKSAAPAQSAAPKRDYKPSPVKFSAESTYNSQHNGEHADPATPFKPEGNNDTIHPSNERFWSTESRNMFDNKGNAQRSSFKPKNVATASVPFEGVTSNKAEYQNWKGARPSSPFRAKNEIDHNPESRDFQSEARKQYVQHPYSKADIFVPKQRASNSAVFNAESTHHSDYTPFVFAPCPAAQLPAETMRQNGHQVYAQAGNTWSAHSR